MADKEMGLDEILDELSELEQDKEQEEQAKAANDFAPIKEQNDDDVILDLESDIDKTSLQTMIDQEVDELISEREFNDFGEKPLTEAEASVIQPQDLSAPRPDEGTFNKEDFAPVEGPKEQEQEQFSKEQSGAATINFEVNGLETLDLNFKVNGQEVKLQVSSKDGFVVKMPNGSKFIVPIKE